ncbi:MAG: adenylate/guanylate cyclase domain-containing protein, partial [Geodermatophilaceae bacterium]
MPTCGRCGQEIAPSAKFCPECGTALGPLSARPQEARKTVTVVFSDLVDSTSLGEELDAESLRTVMDAYFYAMRTVLEQHGGVVEKFIGDAVMAVFGLPRMHEDDALRAVRAAMGMREALAILNVDLAATCGVTLRSRTGVNTGIVVVGDAAGGQRLATGDAVNVAARLEHAAPTGGIVLGPQTFRLVRPFVEVSAIGSLNLKGKSAPVEAWQLVALDPEHESSALAPVRPLVGRLAELATIDARLTAATDNQRVEAVLLVGDPGVGKSRLTREAVDRLATTATVLSASCRPYGRPSFWPVTELLGSVSAHDQPLDCDVLTAMAETAPPDDREAIVERVASLLGLTDAAFPLVECFWATARLFATLAAGRPLVLVIEDLHWAEATLLELLDHLRLSSYPGGLLILATARPEVLNASRSSAVLPPMEVVLLNALSPAESDNLIVAVLGSSSLPANLKSLIRGAAAGNPLFLEQALATWIEEGVLAPVDGGWTVTRPVTEVRVPASLSAIFASRLDRLADEERSVLGAASVAGPAFDRRALQPMLDVVDIATIEDCLQRLLRSGLLVPGRPEGPSERIDFGHASLRDVAYELTLKRDRAAFHERFALWHKSRSDTGHMDGLIGHHLAEAFKYHVELRHSDTHVIGLAFASVRHLVADSQRALRIGDRAGAERLTDRIVAVLSASPPATDAADVTLMEKTAKLLVTMGRWRDAVTLLSPYAASERGPLLRDLGVALCKLHRSEPRSPEYREGQRLLKVAGAPPNRDTDALASLAGTWKGIDDKRAHAFYRRCLDIDPTDPYALGNVLEYEIAAAGALSVVEDMRAQISEANRRCRSQADAGLNLPWAFFDAGKFALLLGRPYDAIAAYCKAAQLTTAEHMLMTSMSSLERLVASGGAIPGSTWVQALLAVARSV